MSVGHEASQRGSEGHAIPLANISQAHGVEHGNDFAASTTTLAHTPKHPSNAKDSQKHSTWTMVLQDTWLLEIVSLCFSIGCFIAIVALLWVYNGRTQPQLIFHVSLNTLVSILATAAKSFMVSAVASALGQLKWCWYTKGQDLNGFQEFDDASRGPWGALTLLYRKKNSPITVIGSMVIVLAVAVDPFAQNLIKYPLKTVHEVSAEATVRKASTFKTPAQSFEFTDAVNAGIWNQAEQIQEQPQCPSANCQWPSFQSVGWCSSCRDAMPLVQLHGCIKPNQMGPCEDTSCSIGFGRGKRTWAAELSCKQTVEKHRRGHREPVKVTTTVNNPYTQVVWPLSRSWDYTYDTKTWLDVMNPVLALGYATLKPQIGASARKTVRVATAQICILSPCLRTYQVTVTGGVAMTNVSAIDYGHVNSYRFREHTEPSLCWHAGVDNLTFDARVPIDSWNDKDWFRRSSFSEQEFDGRKGDGDYLWYDDHSVDMFHNDSSLAFCPLSGYNDIMAEIFNGKIDVGFARIRTEECKGPDEPQCKGMSSSHPKFVIDFMATVREHGLNYTLNGVAASLTRLGLHMSDETVLGNVTTSTVVVQVDWPWLILPVSVELMAIVLLALTIQDSRKLKTPVWKSSALAVFYHGLDGSITRDFDESRTQSRMSASAADIKVRLESADNDRLLLRRVKVLDSEI